MSPRWFPDDLPAPAASQDTEAWWAAAQEHRLVVQRCTACGTPRHPPAPVCASCRSFEHDLVDLPGTGTVFTFTRVHQAFVPSLAEQLPYVVAAIDLDGPGGDVGAGPRIVSNVVDCAPDEVHIGLPVQVVWEELGPELSLPRFVPRSRSTDE